MVRSADRSGNRTGMRTWLGVWSNAGNRKRIRIVLGPLEPCFPMEALTLGVHDLAHRGRCCRKVC
jgi:hypothetical protein